MRSFNVRRCFARWVNRFLPTLILGCLLGGVAASCAAQSGALPSTFALPTVSSVAALHPTDPHSTDPHAINPPPSWFDNPATLLDEVGHLQHGVPAAEAARWKRELKTTQPAAERAAWLHLWLGEWELAQNQQPEKAIWHFRQAQHFTNPHNRCYGLAAYDQAITLFYEGAYADAVDAFSALLRPGHGFPGYDGRNCALWSRHAQVCANYHAEHGRLGIPEPPRLDPLCGAASLAACLRSLSLPYDRATLINACRMTGEGSTARDVLDAGRKLGLNSRMITADDQALIALPKPLVAYVEQDHFVALVRADKAGVSYLCSDCGAWPGGRVDLTWAQWRALGPGLYVAVTKPGSAADILLRQALSADVSNKSTLHPVQLGYNGSLSALHVGIHLAASGALSALRGHIKDYLGFPSPDLGFSNPFSCGFKPDALHCLPFLACPTVPPATASCHAPVAHDPVNLATGEEEYTPEPDLTVYNPVGPSVVWSRIYNSLRSPAIYPLQSTTSYGVGWSSDYDYHIYIPSAGGIAAAYLIFPNGSSINTTVQYPNGGTYPRYYLCGFPKGVPLIMEEIMPSSNVPTFVLIKTDRSRWTFTSGGSTNFFNLTKITDRNGNTLVFNYSGNLLTSITNGQKTLLTINGSQSISDCYGRTVWYGVTSFPTARVPTSYPQSYSELTNVSQIVPTSASPPSPLPSRYAYGYDNVLIGDPGTGPPGEAVAFLHKITVPAPNGGSGTSTATLWYLNEQTDGIGTNPNYSNPATNSKSGPYISAIVDSNGNTTTFTPISGQNQGRKQVVDSHNTVLQTSLYGFDLNMSQTSATDYNQTTTEKKTFDASSNDPYQPVTVTDGNFVTGQTHDQWNYTWDTYGQMLTETPPSTTTAPRSKITYTYSPVYSYPINPVGGIGGQPAPSYSLHPMGELTSINEGSKAATSFTYIDTGGPTDQYGRQYPTGNLATVTGPLPGSPGTTNSISSSFNYDAYGNLTSSIAPGSYYSSGTTVGTIKTTFAYVNDTGDSHTPAFNQNEAIGQPIQITNNNGKSTHLRYDEQGRLISGIDALGNETDYGDTTSAHAGGYNLEGQPLLITYPKTGQTGSGQSSTAYSYNYTGGPLLSESDYDESGAAVRKKTNLYGSEGELLSISGSTEPVSYVYDGLYRLSALKDANGKATNYYYNAAGYLDSITYPGYTGASYPNISGKDSLRFPSYDGNGNSLQRTDGNGLITTYTYNDPESLLTNIHYPTGQSGDALSDVALTYDSYRRLTKMTDANLYSLTYGPTVSGKVLPGYDDLDNPLNMETLYTGLSVGGTTAPQEMQYSYWPDGNRKTMSFPTQQFSYAYDLLGRSSQLVNQSGQGATWSYLDNDWLQTQTDSSGLAMTMAYNPLGQMIDLKDTQSSTLISEFGSTTASSGIQHDAVGNIISVPVVNSGWGTSGRTSYTYDLSQVANAAYNRSQLTQETTTRFNPLTNTYGYDLAGNPTTMRGVTSAGFTPDNQPNSILYDGNGNPKTVSGSQVLFDVENRLQAQTVQSSEQVVDAGVGADNVTRILWHNQDGTGSMWTVDASGNTLSQTALAAYAGWTSVAVSVGTDGTTHVLWNNTDGRASIWNLNASTGSFTQNTFGPYTGWTAHSIADGPDGLLRILWIKSDGNISIWSLNNVTAAYTVANYAPYPGWQAVGVSVDINNGTRLLWNNGSPSNPNAGSVSIWDLNLNSSTYTPHNFGPYPGYAAVSIADGRNGITRILFANANGMSSIWNYNGAAATFTAYDYGPYQGWTPLHISASTGAGTDNNSRVLYIRTDGKASLWMQNPSNGSYTHTDYGPYPETAPLVAKFHYRGDDLRLDKETAQGQTFYLYDGTDPVCELSSSGQVTAVNIVGANGLICRLSGPASMFYAFDERGNVAHRVSGSGSVLSSDVYDAYGQPSTVAVGDVWGYRAQAGYYSDPETGLVLCTHRYYDPSAGRFLNRDPIGSEGGINLYSYTQNNPVNKDDPSGYDAGWAGVVNNGPWGDPIYPPLRPVRPVDCGDDPCIQIWPPSHFYPNPPSIQNGSVQTNPTVDKLKKTPGFGQCRKGDEKACQELRKWLKAAKTPAEKKEIKQAMKYMGCDPKDRGSGDVR